MNKEILIQILKVNNITVDEVDEVLINKIKAERQDIDKKMADKIEVSTSTRSMIYHKIANIKRKI